MSIEVNDPVADRYEWALAGLWSPEAKKSNLEYGSESWCADLSNDRFALEREANRRNADLQNYWMVHYWVTRVVPTKKAGE